MDTKNFCGFTLMEIVIVLILMGILSVGLITVYFSGMRDMDKTDLESETMAVFNIIKREFLKHIREAKNVSWDGTNEILTVTGYNDSIVRFRNGSEDGFDVIQKDSNDGNWNKITSSSMVEYAIATVNSINISSQKIELTVNLNGSFKQEAFEVERKIKIHWRN